MKAIIFLLLICIPCFSATVVNKTNFIVLKIVNTPDYKGASGWWINPVIPKCASIYWKNDGGILTEMTFIEKNSVDSAIALSNAAIKERMKDADNMFPLPKACLQVLFSEINLLRQKAGGMKTNTWKEFKDMIKVKIP